MKQSSFSTYTQQKYRYPFLQRLRTKKQVLNFLHEGKTARYAIALPRVATLALIVSFLVVGSMNTFATLAPEQFSSVSHKTRQTVQDVVKTTHTYAKKMLPWTNWKGDEQIQIIQTGDVLHRNDDDRETRRAWRMEEESNDGMDWDNEDFDDHDRWWSRWPDNRTEQSNWNRDHDTETVILWDEWERKGAGRAFWVSNHQWNVQENKKNNNEKEKWEDEYSDEWGRDEYEDRDWEPEEDVWVVKRWSDLQENGEEYEDQSWIHEEREDEDDRDERIWTDENEDDDSI